MKPAIFAWISQQMLSCHYIPIVMIFINDNLQIVPQLGVLCLMITNDNSECFPPCLVSLASWHLQSKLIFVFSVRVSTVVLGSVLIASTNFSANQSMVTLLFPPRGGQVYLGLNFLMQNVFLLAIVLAVKCNVHPFFFLASVQFTIILPESVLRYLEFLT